MFYNCFSLVGAIKYDDKKANCTYANPNSGYFSSYKTYPLTICGVTVNNLNCGDLTLIEGVGLRDPNGYVTYDPDEFTLNLNSAVITSTGKTAIKFQLGAITRFNINVEEGTSTVRTSSGTSGMAVIDLYNDKEFNNVSEDAYKYYMADPIHPTKEGYAEWWMPKLESEMIRIMQEQ